MKNTLKNLLGKGLLFFDGGTGTILQSKGLKPGELPETWNFKHPDIITQLHYDYFMAGANIIKSNKVNIENINCDFLLFAGIKY